jgi:hypothetical protein
MPRSKAVKKSSGIGSALGAYVAVKDLGGNNVLLVFIPFQYKSSH